jgi:hypothetical protein
MNGVLSREVPRLYSMGPSCKDCAFFVQQHTPLGNYCSKFKTSGIFARFLESKCGPDAKEFRFKDPVKK